MSKFSEYTIGRKCAFLNPYIEKLVNIGILDLKGVNKCFYLGTTLHSGCWVLFGTSIIYVILSTFVLRSCQSKLNKRIQSELDEISIITESNLSENVSKLHKKNKSRQTSCC